MPDLLIGGSRRSPTRRARPLAIGGLLVAVVALVSYLMYRRVVIYAVPDGEITGELTVDPAGAGAAAHALRYGDATLRWAGPIAVLSLRGDRHAIGAAAGRLLAGEVATVSATLVPSLHAAVQPTGWFARATLGMRYRWRLRMLDEGVGDPALQEIAGLWRGSRRSGAAPPSFEELVRSQAALDIGQPPPGSSDADLRTVSHALTVLPAIHAAGDHLLIGRSFSVVGTGDDGAAIAAHPVLALVHPDGGLAYASVTWPGMTGVVTGVNQAGLAVLVHPARAAGVRVTRAGEPIALIARDVLASAKTLDQAIAAIEQSAPLGAAAFVVVDGPGRRAAVIERSPTATAVRREPPAVVSDFLGGQAFASDPENDEARRSGAADARAQRASQLVRGVTDVAGLVALLRDHRSTTDALLPLGHRAAIDDLRAAHTVVIDLSGMVLWIADGPGAGGRLRGFDLAAELEVPAASSVPPADLAADPAGGADAVVAARAAMAELVLARRELAADEPGAADEHAARALALAPDLPAALLTAGRIAEARGDVARAERWFRRYLEVGPDDVEATAQIRARLGRP